MQEQKKFKYIYNNEEVSREDFEKLAGDSFKWFDGDSVVSVPFSSFDSFFTGDFKSRRQINDHLDSVLNIYQNKVTEDIINKPKCSPQCFCNGSCKKPQEKNLGGYKIPNVKVNAARHKAREEGNFHKEIVGDLEGINRPPSTYNGLEKYIDSLKQLKDDVITNSSRGEKEMMKVFENTNTLRDFSEVVVVKEPQTAYKETEGKLNYELDWEFIQQMAERMSQNKDKYEPYPLTPEESLKDDIITNSSIVEKETMEALNNLRNTLNKSNTEIIKEIQEDKQGIKESNGKTDYSEINLEILDLMAERFTANKHKYPKGNMKKPIDIKSLEWALFRHVKKMIQPIETDEETYKDHLSAVLCNASMILDQLNGK